MLKTIILIIMGLIDKILKEVDEWNDKQYRLYEIEYELLHETLSELAEIRDNPNYPNKKQKWEVIPKYLLIKTWNDYVKNGIVRYPKNIDKMEEIIMNNVAQLRVNNLLLGHESRGVDEEDLEMYGFDKQLWKDDSDYIYEYFTDDDEGQLIISDYGLPKIEKILHKMLRETNDEKRLVYIDQILNIIHPRSDLAKYFVEGGSKTLSYLSEKELN